MNLTIFPGEKVQGTDRRVLDILQKNLRIAVLSFLILQGQIFSEGVSTRSHIVVCYTAISHIESGTYVL